MFRALKAEVLKLKGASVPWWTALTVAVSPLMSVTGINLVDPGFKHTTWQTFMRYGPQNIAGWYGILIFGLATAHLFGREYGDGTAKNMLTLPIRREYIIAAKGIVLAVWILVLVVLSVAAQAAFAAVLGLNGFTWQAIASALANSMKVSALIFMTQPLVALLSMIGGSYFAPMLFSAVMTAAGLTFAEIGWARWFPWSMPAAAVGNTIGVPVAVDALVPVSWALMGALFVLGLAADFWFVDRADNTQ